MDNGDTADRYKKRIEVATRPLNLPSEEAMQDAFDHPARPSANGSFVARTDGPSQDAVTRQMHRSVKHRAPNPDDDGLGM